MELRNCNTFEDIIHLLIMSTAEEGTAKSESSYYLTIGIVTQHIVAT